MFNFNFWQRWLLVAGIVIVAFGLGLTFLSQTVILDVLMNQPINLAFWNTPTVAEPIRMFQQWIYAVAGMTTAGWGVFVAFIAYYPFRNRERWAWLCVLSGMTLWFVVDTAYSAYFRVYINVLINVSLYVLVMLPVIFTRKDFVNT